MASDDNDHDETSAPDDEWITLKEAEERTGHKARTIRDHADKGTIREKRESNQPNATRYLLWSDVEKWAAKRVAPATDILPIPAQAWEQIVELQAKVVDATAAKATSEQIEVHLRERVREKSEQVQNLIDEIEAKEAAHVAALQAVREQTRNEMLAGLQIQVKEPDPEPKPEPALNFQPYQRQPGWLERRRIRKAQRPLSG